MLSTVHQVKGKEADHVFLTGVSQGLMPHEKGELPEEKRIFFVACTRAARFLHISYSCVPSMFLQEFLNEFKSLSELQKEIPGSQQKLF